MLVEQNVLQLSHFINQLNVPVNFRVKMQFFPPSSSDNRANLEKLSSYSHFSLILIPLVLDETSSISSPTLRGAVKIHSNLMEWAGRRSAGTLQPSWKELGTGPVAFSAVCLWQLLSRGTGPNAAARHSCPQSLWTVASHTPVEAACPQRPAVPVVKASFLCWKRRGDISNCSFVSCLRHISLQLDEELAFQNNIHTGCN